MRLFLSLCIAFFLTASAQITLWTTEEQPERVAVQERIAAAFEAETGISVTVVPVNESQLGERATAAFAAGDLPDVIYHPLSRTLGWAEAGILEPDIAGEIIEELGEDTFSAGALNLVRFRDGFAAVPVDGWTQLLLYRADLFEEMGLETPNTFERILTAARALHDPPNMYGFVAATDPAQDYMMQVFEHFALANGIQLIDDEGTIDLNTPEMVALLEFYRELVAMSPPGNLYWQQSRELYQAGQAAMIVWSPFILDELAGLRADVPVPADEDHEPGWLARNTGFVTRLAGPANEAGAGWADVRYYGITVDADFEAAQRFVIFSLNEGYLDTLSMAAEGKFPVRRGTAEEPNRFVEGWSGLEVGVSARAPLSDFYSETVIADIIAGLETGTRWAFAQGQGAIVSRLYGTRVMSEAVRAFLDGERTAEETAALLQQRVNALR